MVVCGSVAVSARRQTPANALLGGKHASAHASYSVPLSHSNRTNHQIPSLFDLCRIRRLLFRLPRADYSRLARFDFDAHS